MMMRILLTLQINVKTLKIIIITNYSYISESVWVYLGIVVHLSLKVHFHRLFTGSRHSNTHFRSDVNASSNTDPTRGEGDSVM